MEIGAGMTKNGVSLLFTRSSYVIGPRIVDIPLLCFSKSEKVGKNLMI